MPPTANPLTLRLHFWIGELTPPHPDGGGGTQQRSLPGANTAP